MHRNLPQQYPIGIMFHHLHRSDAKHPHPGSLSAEDFEELISKLSHNGEILSAGEWIERSRASSLKPRDMCITFDDGIQEQYDVAKNVLDAFQIKAFFFIVSGVFDEPLPKLEIYSAFRDRYFKSFSDFFSALCERLSGECVLAAKRDFPSDFLAEYTYYTFEERLFRYLRDVLLSKEQYEKIMDAFVEELSSVEELATGLWMGRGELQMLASEGHIVGLHSRSHPMRLDLLSAEEQLEEFSHGKEMLSEITGSQVVSASYPCGRYNSDTLHVMKELGIEVAFRAEQQEVSKEPLEYPRIDCSLL